MRLCSVSFSRWMNRRHAETADHDRSVKIKLTAKHDIRSQQLVLVSLQQRSGTRRGQVASEGAPVEARKAPWAATNPQQLAVRSPRPVHRRQTSCVFKCTSVRKTLTLVTFQPLTVNDLEHDGKYGFIVRAPESL